jgi:glycosyltransferase involved in cell wall biosynthesis
MNPQLTISIVTKERPLKLERCLESICKQSILPTSVLIVDNDIKKTAYPVYLKYKKSLNMNYVLEKKAGVPRARNAALKKAKTRFLGFVDDDCILDKHWVKAAISKLTSANRRTYVVGRTLFFNKNSLLALAQSRRDTYWKLKLLKKGNETMEYHFDTKNVVFDKDKVLAHKMEFDPSCSIGRYDSGDFDFGMQLKDKSLKGVYVKKMLLFHEEESSLIKYLKKAYFRGKIAAHISHKWKLGHKLVNLSAQNIKWWIYDSINNFSKEKRMYTRALNISEFKKTLLTLIIRISDRVYLQGYLSYLKENKNV